MQLGGTALVVGGGSGIGQEVAFAFAEAGCRAVAVADIHEQHAADTVQQSKQYAARPAYKSYSFRIDVIDEADVHATVERVVSALGGRIDYFVNCAGVGNMSSFPVSDMNIDHFDRVVRINLYGTINCMKAVSKIMQAQTPITFTPDTPRLSRHPPRSLGRGSIVNLASVNAIVANPGNTSYVTSKSGVLAATKVAALDLAKDQIRVNAILPGGTDTPMLAAAFKQLPKFKQFAIDRTPLRRLAQTDEIADSIVHLCSHSASYITGSAIVIDGGITASKL